MVELKYFNGCVYCLYSQHYARTVGRNLNLLTVVTANNIENFVVRASEFGIRGEARLVEIRSERQRGRASESIGRILLVGEDNVY